MRYRVKTFRERLLTPLGVCLLVFMISPAVSSAQGTAASLHEFLAQYAGREILLVDSIAEHTAFFDQDSASKYVFVLDQVLDDIIVVHRSTASDKRSLVFPLADIRRITYLFGGRPYQRIVLETY